MHLFPCLSLAFFRIVPGAHRIATTATGLDGAYLLAAAPAKTAGFPRFLTAVNSPSCLSEASGPTRGRWAGRRTPQDASSRNLQHFPFAHTDPGRPIKEGKENPAVALWIVRNPGTVGVMQSLGMGTDDYPSSMGEVA